MSARVSRWLICGLTWLSACQHPESPTHDDPAQVECPVGERELPRVQLSSKARERLQIETTVVESTSARATRLVGGEVIAAPGRSFTVAAPIAGMIQAADLALPQPGDRVRGGTTLLRIAALAPADRDTRARARREVAAAEANLRALELRVTRNEALVEERAGSPRALEESIAARDVARADLSAARSRASTLAKAPLLSDVAMEIAAPADGVVRQVLVADGQSVAAGAILFEVVDTRQQQVRVPIHSTDLHRLALELPVQVSRGGDETKVSANFVAGPPTADPINGTVDHYLSLPDSAVMEPGERVLVDVPLTTSTARLRIPASAVVVDAWGGAWIYTCDEGDFIRQRVDPERRVDNDYLLASGPPPGTCVVAAGAVELFGAEFPPGH